MSHNNQVYNGEPIVPPRANWAKEFEGRKPVTIKNENTYSADHWEVKRSSKVVSITTVDLSKEPNYHMSDFKKQ